jgi:RNA polymerase sigma-70 factor, ECF subfamily
VDSDESSILVKAGQGDPAAFSQLVELYQRPVYNLCYRMLGSAEDAEDAAQETFLRAYKSLRHYDRERPFSTWLLSIAAHHCIDTMRRRRMVVVSIDDFGLPDLPDESPDSETQLSRKEERASVQALLDDLSATDRALVVMYYWNDLSYSEIAHALRLTESAVKSRLHRARRVMAHSWQEQESKVSLVSERVIA